VFKHSQSIQLNSAKSSIAYFCKYLQNRWDQTKQDAEFGLRKELKNASATLKKSGKQNVVVICVTIALHKLPENQQKSNLSVDKLHLTSDTSEPRSTAGTRFYVRYSENICNKSVPSRMRIRKDAFQLWKQENSLFEDNSIYSWFSKQRLTTGNGSGLPDNRNWHWRLGKGFKARLLILPQDRWVHGFNFWLLGADWTGQGGCGQIYKRCKVLAYVGLGLSR